MNHPLRAGLSPLQIHGAAMAANEAYDKNRSNLFETVRTIKPFWFWGNLIACTRVDDATDTAYVAVRGTWPIGNWFLTNFQAFYTTLNVVDDSLKGENSKFQGGKLCRPVKGRVHQGFMRSFSRLWYDTEPVFRAEPVNRRTAVKTALKYALLFFGPLIVLLSAETFGLLTKADNTSIAAVCLFTAMIVVMTEKGIIEGLFTKADPPDGTPISELLFKLNQHKQVVFTGHSLGGAIATLMFAIYRSWCSNDLSRRRNNGHLVTFGSARVGDECFVESFERNHGERMLHFEHPGDPVPQIPPNGLVELVTRRYIIRGPAGFIISLLFVPWTAFRVIYTTRPKRWSEDYVDTMGERPFRRLCFTFHSMTKFYLDHTQKALKRRTVDA